MKEKVHKLEFIKIKNFCSVKDTIKRMKTSQDWEKIFAKYTSDKVVVSKIYKEFLQLNHKKATQLKYGQKT